MADGDDIRGAGNQSLPHWPRGLPLRHKVLCLFGYHKPEVRYAPRRIRSMDGAELPVTRLRDQCVRCRTLLDIGITDRDRVEAARNHAQVQRIKQLWED